MRSSLNRRAFMPALCSLPEARARRCAGRPEPESGVGLDHRVGRGFSSGWVSQVKGTASLGDDRVVEELVAPVQLREVGDPLAEQYRHQAETRLIYQTEVECLVDDSPGARLQP